MMKKLIATFIILILGLTTTLSVSADSGISKKIGDKLILESGHESTYIGKTADGLEDIWQVNFSSIKYIPGTNIPIDCSWEWDSDKLEWCARSNLFTSIVKDTKVTVWNEGKKLSWQPDVYIETKKLASDKIPSLISQDPINENYYGNTLQWDYGNGITRNLRIIEGMLIEYYTISTLPADDIYIIPHTTKDLGFVWTRPSSAWDADGELVPLAIGVNGELILSLETIQGATLPITIDPDTTFTSSSSDGYIYYITLYDASRTTVWNEAHDKTYGTSSTAGDTAHVQARLTIDYYEEYAAQIHRAFVFFDTSSLLGDATITGAILKLYCYDKKTEIGAFDVIIQGGMPTYPHNPLITSDYYYTRYGDDYGQLNSGSISTGQYNNWTLTAAGKAAINKEGDTKFIIREEQHDEDDVVPPAMAKANKVTFYTYEKGVGYRPELVVTYSASAAPTVETEAASLVAKTTARLNSLLSADGGGPCDARFGYGTTSQATIAAYDEQTAWTGYIYSSGEHPFEDIDTLVANTEYFFRVEMRNDAGTTLGDELTFTTINAIDDPTNLRGYPQATSISLSWTKGAGSTQSLVRYAFGDFPATTASGIEVYLGTSSTYTHTGLTPGTNYYYSVWGESGGDYSTSYDEAMATTSASEVTGESLPVAPAPAGWMQSPDPTVMENIEPIYTIVNNLADAYEIPKETFWLGLTMLFCLVISVLVYLAGHNLVAASLTLAVFTALGVRQELLPFWMVFAVILVNIVIIAKKREVI